MSNYEFCAPIDGDIVTIFEDNCQFSHEAIISESMEEMNCTNEIETLSAIQNEKVDTKNVEEITKTDDEMMKLPDQQNKEKKAENVENSSPERKQCMCTL